MLHFDTSRFFSSSYEPRIAEAAAPIDPANPDLEDISLDQLIDQAIIKGDKSPLIDRLATYIDEPLFGVMINHLLEHEHSLTLISLITQNPKITVGIWRHFESNIERIQWVHKYTSPENFVKGLVECGEEALYRFIQLELSKKHSIFTYEIEYMTFLELACHHLDSSIAKSHANHLGILNTILNVLDTQINKTSLPHILKTLNSLELNYARRNGFVVNSETPNHILTRLTLLSSHSERARLVLSSWLTVESPSLLSKSGLVEFSNIDPLDVLRRCYVGAVPDFSKSNIEMLCAKVEKTSLTLTNNKRIIQDGSDSKPSRPQVRSFADYDIRATSEHVTLPDPMNNGKRKPLEKQTPRKLTDFIESLFFRIRSAP